MPEATRGPGSPSSSTSFAAQRDRGSSTASRGSGRSDEPEQSSPTGDQRRADNSPLAGEDRDAADRWTHELGRSPRGAKAAAPLFDRRDDGPKAPALRRQLVLDPWRHLGVNR